MCRAGVARRPFGASAGFIAAHPLKALDPVEPVATSLEDALTP
jgi:hypothetical protein